MDSPVRRSDQKNGFYRMLSFFRPHQGRIALLLGIILMSAALNAIPPLAVQQIFDKAFPQKNIALLAMLSLVLIIVPALVGLLSIAGDYLKITTGQYVMHSLRVQLYARLQALSLNFYTTTPAGEMISRLSNDVNGVQDALTETIGKVASNMIALLVTLLVMLYLNVPLTILSFVLTPLFLYLATRVGGVVRNVSTQKQQSLATLMSILEETLNVSGALLVKSFRRQQDEIERFSRQSKHAMMAGVRQTMIGRWFLLSFHIFFNMVPALIYYIGGLQIIGGTLSPGSLVAFIALQSSLFPRLRELLDLQISLQGALALFRRIYEYLDLPIEIKDRSDAAVLEEVRGDIRFRHVGFHYQTGYTTLNDVDFEIQPGQLVALVGPSGSGKTTIGYLLARFYDVTRGAIEIDGHDIRTVTLESLARHTGIVTQETYLLNVTIRENILYGKPEASEEEMVAAAKAASIHDRIMALPDGYETVVGVRGYTLSGGEKQRIALARVLLKNPVILILDEATSALDTYSEHVIQVALSKAQKRRSTLAIAHRLSTILAADQILVLNDGRIVERGTHQELLRQNGLYRQLYDEQFRDGPDADNEYR